MFTASELGTCDYADGCNRPASFVRDDVGFCRTCKIQAQMGIASKERTEEEKERARPIVIERPANLPPGMCWCECGGRPKGKKRRYLPGHDARHKARLAAERRRKEKK